MPRYHCPGSVNGLRDRATVRPPAPDRSGRHCRSRAREPAARTLDGPFPLLVSAIAPGHRAWLEDAIRRPVLRDGLGGRPHVLREARGVLGAQRGGLADLWADHRDAEN